MWRTILISLLASACLAAPAAAAPPYDPTFVLNRPIPADYPYSANAAANDRIIANIHGGRRVAAIAGETPPLNVVSAADPFRQVDIGPVHGQFRIPAGLKVGTGLDHPTEILDPSTYTELRVWRASWNGTTLTGANASVSYYNNNGVILNPNGTRSTSHAFIGQATGSGLTYYAGLTTRADEASWVKHGTRVAYSAAAILPTWVTPATKSDGRGSGAGAVPMGSIFRIHPRVNCTLRTAPGEPSTTFASVLVQRVCRSIRRYGMVIADNTGGYAGINIYFEDSSTAAWPSVLGSDRGCGNYGFLFRNYGSDPYIPDCAGPRRDTDGVPWHELRLIVPPRSHTAW